MPCSKFSAQSWTYLCHPDVYKQHCQNLGSGQWFCWGSCPGFLGWVPASKDTVVVGLAGHSHASFPPATASHHAEGTMGWVTEDGPKYKTPILGDLVLFMVKPVPSSGRCPCPWQGVGTRWSLRSLLTQTILWFDDSMILTSLPHIEKHC